MLQRGNCGARFRFESPSGYNLPYDVRFAFIIERDGRVFALEVLRHSSIRYLIYSCINHESSTTLVADRGIRLRISPRE